MITAHAVSDKIISVTLAFTHSVNPLDLGGVGEGDLGYTAPVKGNVVEFNPIAPADRNLNSRSYLLPI